MRGWAPSTIKGWLMQGDSSRFPSVACLLYLAADEIAPRRMSVRLLQATKVPCRPVWVHPIRLSATIAAATYLSLRDAGSLKLHLQEVTSKNPNYKMRRGRLRTHTRLTMTEADLTPRKDLAGPLLVIASGRRKGLLGEFRAGGGLVANVGFQNDDFAYFFVLDLVRRELLDAGYYTRSHGRVQPDCERIATLAQARAATVRWWEQRQATEPRLCAALVAVCERASTPRREGAGG
jgi:hypothetical protein